MRIFMFIVFGALSLEVAAWKRVGDDCTGPSNCIDSGYPYGLKCISGKCKCQPGVPHCARRRSYDVCLDDTIKCDGYKWCTDNADEQNCEVTNSCACQKIEVKKYNRNTRSYDAFMEFEQQQPTNKIPSVYQTTAIHDNNAGNSKYFLFAEKTGWKIDATMGANKQPYLASTCGKPCPLDCNGFYSWKSAGRTTRLQMTCKGINGYTKTTRSCGSKGKKTWGSDSIVKNCNGNGACQGIIVGPNDFSGYPTYYECKSVSSNAPGGLEDGVYVKG